MIPYQKNSGALVTVPKQKPDPQRLRIHLNEERTKRIIAFADALNYQSFNDALNAVIDAGLSAVPTDAIFSAAKQREIWQIRMSTFSAMNQFFDERAQLAKSFAEDAARSLEVMNQGANDKPPEW